MKIKRTKDADIRFGNVNLDPDEFAPENVRVRISIMIPMNVLEGFRSLAAKRGAKYQTLMNDVLREYIARDQGQSSPPVWSASQPSHPIEGELMELRRRVDALEAGAKNKGRKRS